jgi:hypothetical protein
MPRTAIERRFDLHRCHSAATFSDISQNRHWQDSSQQAFVLGCHVHDTRDPGIIHGTNQNPVNFTLPLALVLSQGSN